MLQPAGCGWAGTYIQYTVHISGACVHVPLNMCCFQACGGSEGGSECGSVNDSILGNKEVFVDEEYFLVFS